ncbi:MAG: MobC family plasmid mobilization relaxosome protein [Acidobacteriota bacterium]|nr:MobC family plasmid mobilization relaxosome protein [Acidobacteriota bacterium]
MAERRSVEVHLRVSPAERAAWKAKAAAAGLPLSALVRQAMARTQTWTAPAMAAEHERSRQIARVGNNLNQVARWANTHASALDAVRVLNGLRAVERALRALALPAGGDGDAR